MLSIENLVFFCLFSFFSFLKTNDDNTISNCDQCLFRKSIMIFVMLWKHLSLRLD